MLQWIPTTPTENRKLFIMPRTKRAKSQADLTPVPSAFPPSSEAPISASPTTEETRQMGFDQGYKDGLKQARQELEEAAEKALEAKLLEVQQHYEGSINELIVELNSLKLDFQLSEKKQLMELVKGICEKILSHELTAPKRKINQTISSALKGLSCDSAFVLSISADDEALIKSEPHEELTSVTIDPSLKRGQFILDSPRQQLKVDPEQQLHRILYDLFSSEAKS
ncbi:FliH/SctL family protein [uncultured Umboniibacter sp.]|uniref:FliH/SctL family protein n=1 Tax=uncultured Umboniibacter sp. TaxID=1798917 RepID=UPI002622829F|nr:FliH/SctL family protein [uncultured Umboniibacter sp.]